MVLIPVAKSKTTHLGRITAEALACAVRVLEGGGVSAIAPASVRAFAGTPAPLMASIAPATPPVMAAAVPFSSASAGDVLLSAAPRLLLNATRQSGKSTVAALKAAWTVLQGGLAVVVSPSLRQSGFLFRKLAR